MNKGFTLVELLAVIIIIVAISTLVTFTVSNIIKDSKGKLDAAQKTIIEDATGMWFMDNLVQMPDTNNSCIYITLGELKDYGSINDVRDINTLENLPNSLKIKIDITNDTKYSITVDADDITGCSKFYE